MGSGATLAGVNDPLVIEARPATTVGRLRLWLRGRRLMLSVLLALAEVVAFIVWRPNALLMATLAVILLIFCVMGASRLRAGLLRDLLWIVAIAQGIVVAIPVAVGLSVVAGLLLAVVLIIALVAVAARSRR